MKLRAAQVVLDECVGVGRADGRHSHTALADHPGHLGEAFRIAASRAQLDAALASTAVLSKLGFCGGCCGAVIFRGC